MIMNQYRWMSERTLAHLPTDQQSSKEKISRGERVADRNRRCSVMVSDEFPCFVTFMFIILYMIIPRIEYSLGLGLDEALKRRRKELCGSVLGANHLHSREGKFNVPNKTFCVIKGLVMSRHREEYGR
jgi:hypothetical protein